MGLTSTLPIAGGIIAVIIIAIIFITGYVKASPDTASNRWKTILYT